MRSRRPRSEMSGRWPGCRLCAVDVRHSSAQFTSGGEHLYLQTWLPSGPDGAAVPAPSAVVAAVHGYGDHGGRYVWLGEDLVARGHALYVFDLRGHGQSSGTRGQIRRFEEYLDDLAVFLDEVRRVQPAAPLFLLGHSMGGLICARFAEERGSELGSRGVASSSRMG